MCFTLSTFQASAQCGAETFVTLSSQADVDAFIADNCTNFLGNITIQGGDITSLTPLASLTSVGGDLFIKENGMLSSLTGLEGLSSVGEDLLIFENAMLSSLTGLEGLTSVGDLFIEENGNLSSLIGLEGLTSVGEYLIIEENGNLSSLTGLEGLTSVGRGLFIEENAMLSSLAGLEGITSVGEDLGIIYNATLGSNGVSDYCGLFTLLDGGGLTGSYTVSDNNTNPTQMQIINNGPCAPPCTNITCYADTDSDTFGDPDNTTDDTCECGTGYVENGDDCNDNDPSINDINTAIYTHEGSCYATLAEAITAAGGSGTVEINFSVDLQTASTVPAGLTIAIQDGVTVTNSSLLSNGGTITLLGTAQFVNDSGGTYTGGGTFDGDFVNNGTIQIGN